ncbi:hypothetical protein L1286_22795 [Pseudoalteromonas sp. SMS1]|uniref:hypothetical protein n=1 Tax=Pseudoalteromonas sp. SMS1 TaxID=2908894 RepID=UPI001F431C08|nr:hypothetical protein [Pseudoalteromonas sp. SMS1]MCF2860313.1 hypothetical protein [Pseudoalteromonas sp. SMS1]
MKRAQVIAISGASGSGKSSVIKLLCAHFNCPSLLFDDFVTSRTYPKDMKNWFSEGGELALIQAPQLERALQHLRQQTESDYIFVEEPFGRCRPSIAPLIDYVVLINTPLELCLARVILRNIAHSTSNTVNSITQYLAQYESHLRDIYLHVSNEVKAQSDLVIQDEPSTEAIKTEIITWLKSLSNQ